MKDTFEILRDYMLKPKGMFIWRDIPDHEGRYQISNHGEVRTIKNKILTGYGNHVILTSQDKSRHTVSVKKLMKAYWREHERNQGEEQWKRLDYYSDYFISNYEQIKNCKVKILWPNKSGNVVLTKNKHRESISVLKLFLNTFPPYEVEVNHESKTVNYKKGDFNIASKQKQG